MVTRRARLRVAVAVGLAAASAGPACARVSGLDGLTRDDCALGCVEEGGVDVRPRADAPDTAVEAAPKDSVTCGAGRCAPGETCCIRAGQAPACASRSDGGCAGAFSVGCEDDTQCAALFTAGARCCGSPPSAASSLICFDKDLVQQQGCALPRCDPASADAGCGAGRTCAPVRVGAAVGVCQ